MSIGLPEKAEQKTEQVLVRLTKREKRKLARIAEEIGVSQAAVGHHAIVALIEGYEGEPPSPSKRERNKK